MNDPENMPSTPLVGWRNLGEYFLSIYSIALVALGVKMFLADGADSQVAIACFGFLAGLGLLCVALIEVVKIHARRSDANAHPHKQSSDPKDRVI